MYTYAYDNRFYTLFFLSLSQLLSYESKKMLFRKKIKVTAVFFLFMKRRLYLCLQISMAGGRV